jgi:hypothetical protein
MGGYWEALADPALFLEIMGALREAADDDSLQAWLAARGLQLSTVVGMMVDVALDEPVAENSVDERVVSAASKAGRQAITRLHAHGVEPEQISVILDIPGERVNGTLGARDVNWDRNREIVRRHQAKESVSSIAQALGVSRNTVYKALPFLGIETGQPVRRPGLRDRIVALRNTGKGYGEIMAETGATTNQVRNALRARKHQVNDYGKRSLVSA